MIDLMSLLVPLGMAVVSFFAYKILGIATKTNDLHKWHSRTDSDGKFIWYENAKAREMCQALHTHAEEIGTTLHSHIDREEVSLRELGGKVDAIQLSLVAHKGELEHLHSRLGTLATDVQGLESYIKHKCESGLARE